MYSLLRDQGQIGYVVPSGIYTDLGTKELRKMLLNEGNIQYIYSFSNERFFFPGVDHRFKFAMIGAQRGPQSDGFWAAFRFNPRVAVAPDELPEFLGILENLVYIKGKSLERFSPDSLSLMEFQTQRDYSITEQIYGSWSLIGEALSDTWNVKFNREFDMTNDRHLFNTKQHGLPLYEGKTIHQFDAFFGELNYWVGIEDAIQRLENKTQTDFFSFRATVRAVASSTNERTLISTVIPPQVVCGNSLLVVSNEFSDSATILYLTSILNGYLLDFVLRQKVTSNINMFFLYQLPVPRLNTGNPHFDAIVPRAARLICTRPEFADLWQSVMGETWHESDGATDPTERQQLRDEIDAIVAHLYGLSRDDFDHILGMFPLVFPDTEEDHDKRAALLAVYDAWAGKL